ncbi:anhydro-N-acetylmuramic acid kinase [Mesonia ostreae]|uniref:Anhydro-N-acetylmuramic acid kinase n=1 Tax=Mesonia ostreae TaxID=861110 RepID=A0ABU2KH35_9FLAO|nr:anhydro-N-acetylmuramic acid kinase [Mesonia ostreae]MDT0294025.1 anhydro-N-acetylmuramic acid kinase [Mesonia ostreae]
MNKLVFQVMGVMSGTSLDGIDLACIELLELEGAWEFKIMARETLAYPETWRRKLENASLLSKTEIADIDKEYTLYLAEVIQQFLKKNKLSQDSLDAVCSHGHTVLHQPENGITIQIGNNSALAKKIGIKTVCDFRVQDVELGGQGAPLVPIGDQLLFAKYEYCLNLGGFANISSEKNGKRIAYDICAVNTVLNFLAEQVGCGFDEDGKIAASGKIDDNFLANLNALSFYQQSAPKSLGIEWVKATIFPLINKASISVKDKIATYTFHSAQQIALQLKGNFSHKVLITGGGAFNATLIKHIQNLSEIQLVIPENELVEYKEALVFGLLGVLKLTGKMNVLKSVTGASKDHSSGKIFLP